MKRNKKLLNIILILKIFLNKFFYNHHILKDKSNLFLIHFEEFYVLFLCLSLMYVLLF